ncbi:hypothetical protein ACSFE6_14790 [Pseudomonas baetica]|uniref:hypothetical protein n=1 Tax=Pseudomonas baetica TaxID=674054 RepID=UPI003EEA6075
MMNLKITSLMLAGLLSVTSQASFAAPGDDAGAAATKSGTTSRPVMPPDNMPASPSGGNAGDGGATRSSSSTSGSANGSGFGSGSGAGGGTGPAGGGTGGAGGGTGSRW